MSARTPVWNIEIRSPPLPDWVTDSSRFRYLASDSDNATYSSSPSFRYPFPYPPAESADIICSIVTLCPSDSSTSPSTSNHCSFERTFILIFCGSTLPMTRRLRPSGHSNEQISPSPRHASSTGSISSGASAYAPSSESNASSPVRSRNISSDARSAFISLFT